MRGLHLPARTSTSALKRLQETLALNVQTETQRQHPTEQVYF
jgi:hypothetical protein